MERMANIILGQKASADTLPKRLTEVASDPDNPKTKVPLEKLKKDYYKGRGQENGIPTYKTLKRFGVKLYKEYYDKVVQEAMAKQCGVYNDGESNGKTVWRITGGYSSCERRSGG